MRHLLKDEQKQKELDVNGYTILSPFMGDREVEQIVSLYHSSRASTNVEGYRLLSNELQDIGVSRFDDHFDGYAFGIQSFVVKKPGRKVLLPHQDISSVDETQCQALIVWIPMIDTHLDNGALGVIKGSHRFFPDTRCSPNVCCREKLPYAEYTPMLFPYMTFLAMKAGEALVLDSSIIHGSTANVSQDLRITARFGVTHAEAAWYHFSFVPDTDLTRFETYEVNKEFFLENDQMTLMELFRQGKRLEGFRSLGIRDHPGTRASREQMVALMESAGNRFDESLVERSRLVPTAA